jgi:hypothetical protein
MPKRPAVIQLNDNFLPDKNFRKALSNPKHSIFQKGFPGKMVGKENTKSTTKHA